MQVKSEEVPVGGWEETVSKKWVGDFTSIKEMEEKIKGYFDKYSGPYFFSVLDIPILENASKKEIMKYIKEKIYFKFESSKDKLIGGEFIMSIYTKKGKKWFFFIKIINNFDIIFKTYSKEGKTYTTIRHNKERPLIRIRLP